MLQCLKGIKVVELTLAGAGPACGRILRDFGVESILVEPSSGTITRNLLPGDYWTSGKRSIALNTKTPEGYEVLTRLIKEADVFLANYRTKGLRNMKLSYEEVKAINPKIIYATLTGFGQTGPIADAPGNNVSAFYSRGGTLSCMSQGDVLPYGTISFGDVLTGSSLALGICAALYHREKTGEGTEVHSSLLQNGYFANLDPMIECQTGSKFPKSRKAPSMGTVNSYQTKDGRYVYICLDKLDPFFRLLKAFGRDDLLEDPQWKTIEDTKWDKAPAVVELLDGEFGKCTIDEAMEVIRKADVSAQKVYTVNETLEDPQAWENGYLYHGKDYRNGQDRIYPVAPVQIGDLKAPEYIRGPFLAEHSVEILKEVGYSDAEIQELLDKGITRDGSKENLYKAF